MRFSLYKFSKDLLDSLVHTQTALQMSLVAASISVNCDVCSFVFFDTIRTIVAVSWNNFVGFPESVNIIESQNSL